MNLISDCTYFSSWFFKKEQNSDADNEVWKFNNKIIEINNFIAQKIESIKKTHSQMHILVQTGTCTHNLSFKIIITKKDKQLHVHVIQL